MKIRTILIFSNWSEPQASVSDATSKFLASHITRRRGMFAWARTFLRDESGATAIEYGLIAALIALAIIGAATTVGSNLATTFGNIGSAL
jgi:pilus assembly protein Flp/PilA